MDEKFTTEIKEDDNKLNKDFSNERALWLGLASILLSLVLFLSFQLIKISPPHLIFSPLMSGEDEDSNLSKINFVYKTIVQNYIEDVDVTLLSKKAITAMLESLEDPYSVYLDNSNARNLNDTVMGAFGGLGITISKKKLDNTNKQTVSNEKDYYVIINNVMENSPARKVGILSGDYITQINGQDVKSLSSEETVEWLRGKPGSTVKLTIMRGASTFDMDVKREIINVITVKHAMIDDSDIAYIKILQFTPKTPTQVKEALLALAEKKYTKLIFDVRDNGGGSLESCIETIDEILNTGTIVSTKGRNKRQNNVNIAKENSIVTEDIPIIVLVNENSASASEIFAGSLKDNGRATLIGSKTFGKGRVQAVYPINKDYSQSFKLTVASYFTPNGIDIDKQGITPDIEILEYTKVEETKENISSMQKMINSGELDSFLASAKNPTPEEIAEFVKKLNESGNSLPNDYLTKLIVMLAQGRMDNPPVYDLRFDKALNKAITSF